MKLAWIAVMVVPVVAFAQYSPGSAPRSYTPGNVLHPGGIPPQPAAGAPVLPMGGYGQHTSRRGNHGGSTGRVNAPHPPHDRSAIVPIYFGGGFGPGYSEPYAEQQQAQQQQEVQDPPVLVINQDYKPQMLNPVVHDYSDVDIPPSPPLEQRMSTPPPAFIQRPDPSPTIYLIALTDGSIVAALGYWMEGDTLNYITREGTRNRVTIDRVDRPFSSKLNADRNLEFKLQ